MVYQKEWREADGHRMTVYRPVGEGPFPVIWLCVGAADAETDQLAELCPVPALLTCAEADWNRDYTPWPAPGLRDRPPFGGEGAAHLRLLTEVWMPVVAAQYPVRSGAAYTAIMGYSLAGLFALWAACESERFGAAASLSGSLWYDGFIDYVNKENCKPDKRIYLSLGKSEERAGDPRMASVGDNTRGVYTHFLPQLGEERICLDWNRGGHFTGIPNRWRKALEWITKEWE
ncbi:MAG: alpha/beta hydrolase [Ruminococcaceae bacterium]|nr:alpha/beta hydrolase [Oscillospiraceae bacterium]